METYEVVTTRKIEETIIVKASTKAECMAAAVGALKGKGVSDICVKDIKLLPKKGGVYAGK